LRKAVLSGELAAALRSAAAVRDAAVAEVCCAVDC
jgi:hypothetical protein